MAVTIFGATLLAAVPVLSAVWRRPRRTAVSGEDAAFVTRRLTPGLAGYVSHCS